ncbi:uncharacterized protein LOC134677346 [Cydia fagiglandana]|uniref:uncharacterized protein LOC134677346 n=1 Tax=Cydia fagiglandana TaxID=1458189 RepID=UPI002FEE0E13
MGSLQAESEEKQEMDDSGCIQDETPPSKRYPNGVQGVQLLDLSDDVLLMILRYLTPRDLRALGYTCPRLGALILDRSLWQTVDGRAQPWGRARLRWYLARALHAGTRELLVSGYAREARECLGHVNQTREEIEAAKERGDKDNAKEEDNNNQPDERRFAAQRVIEVPALGPNAQLYIDDQSSNSPEAFAWPRPSDPIISDSTCPGPQFTLTPSTLRQLADTCPTLTSLALEYCNINCNCTSISMFPPTLKKLSLRGSKCYNLPLDRSFLFKIQDSLPDLESLDVSECEWMEPATLLPLSKLPVLKHLYARDCLRLTEFVAYASLATRYGFTKLQSLDLRGSPVGDSEVSALGWLATLSRLWLSPARAAPPPAQHAHRDRDPPPAASAQDQWEDQHAHRDRDPPPAASAQDQWEDQHAHRDRDPPPAASAQDQWEDQHAHRDRDPPPAASAQDQWEDQHAHRDRDPPPAASAQDQWEDQHAHRDRDPPPAASAQDQWEDQLWLCSCLPPRQHAHRDRDPPPAASAQDQWEDQHAHRDRDPPPAASAQDQWEDQLWLCSCLPPRQHAHRDRDPPPAASAQDQWEDQEPEYFKIKEPDYDDTNTPEQCPDENNHTWQAKLNGTSSDYSSSLPTVLSSPTMIINASPLRPGSTPRSNPPRPSGSRPDSNDSPSISNSSPNEPKASSPTMVIHASPTRPGSSNDQRSTISRLSMSPNISITPRPNVSPPKTCCNIITPSSVLKSRSNSNPGPSKKRKTSSPSPGPSKRKRDDDSSSSDDDDVPLKCLIKPNVNEGASTSKESEEEKEDETEEAEENGQEEEEAQPRHHVLYVNVGQRLHAVYRLSLDNEHVVSFNRNSNLNHNTRNIFLSPPGSHLDASSLVTDSAIRRFGRADGEDINYVHIGPNGPYPGAQVPGARPDRSSLTHLSVTGFRTITDRSLDHLATSAPLLQFLDLSETNVTDAGVAAFRSLRPDCEVIYSKYEKKD